MMKRLAAMTVFLGALPAMNSATSGESRETAPNAPFKYPAAPKANVFDEYHGERVADPFRPLEELDSTATREWIEAENKLTYSYLEAIPARKVFKDRLTKLWDYEKFGVPQKEGSRYFFTRNSGLQNQSVLYTTESLAAEPRELLDPNSLSKDGTVALAGTSISDDGKLIAYGLAEAGSDWNEWRVRDVATGRDLADRLKWIKFSGAAWTKDGKGFYYSRFPEPAAGADLKEANYFQKLYYHRVGDSQDRDELVYERPDQKKWQFHATVSDDGTRLIVTISQGTDDKYKILVRDLTDPAAKLVELVGRFDYDYTFLDNDGPILWFRTNLNAPRGRVIAIDSRDPAPERFKEIIPQTDDTLDHVSVVGDRFIAVYLKDAHSVVKIHRLDGGLEKELPLPGLGTATGFGGKRKDAETFYALNSFTAPTTIYRYDFTSGASEIFRRPKVDFDPSLYETRQVFYKSKDGTRIPLFLSYKKGLERTGENPTYLYGYGGFNIPITPTFSPSNLAWMEQGGLFAVANMRGGGEYGEEWHQAGTKLKKQNVFDDFIAAAEYLIAEKYTSTPRLAIGGRSNGGLLIGACMTQRPDLFGVALPGVGVLDMLRFHKFTIGWAWIDDYGSSDDPEQFRALYAYSPLHRVKPGTRYPATLITTGDHDDRVFPAHSFKFAAALQEAQAGPEPILIRIETRAGHGAGKPTSKVIDEYVDQWAFVADRFGMKIQ
jgi:prolyl oligopeptidase